MHGEMAFILVFYQPERTEGANQVLSGASWVI
jgi:hypothetical protein